MSTRRRPPEPGHRPRRASRFAAGVCRNPACRATFVLDRQTAPWSRARTCSDYCAKVVANRGRTPSTCRHCDMVEAYHLQRDAELQQIEVAAQDEDRRPVTFREFIEGWEYESWTDPQTEAA